MVGAVLVRGGRPTGAAHVRNLVLAVRHRVGAGTMVRGLVRGRAVALRRMLRVLLRSRIVLNVSDIRELLVVVRGGGVIALTRLAIVWPPLLTGGCVGQGLAVVRLAARL